MNLITSFDPSSHASGTFNTSLGVGGRFVAFNESNIGVKFTFDDGSTAYLPSWTTMIYIQPTPSSTVTWSQANILGGTPGPISQVNIEVYQPGETVSGVYPFSLIRQLSVSNLGVVTNVATATSIQNDNNGAGTSIIEATVTGSPQSNVAVDNSGNVTIGEWTGAVFTKNLQVFANATPSVKLGAVGHTTEVLGGLTVDGASTLTGAVQVVGDLDTDGNLSADGTLVVDGTASFNGGNVTVDVSNNVNCNAVNTNAVNTGVDNVTTINATTINANGNLIFKNNTAEQWKDSGGTARNVLNVDGSNHTNLSGITGTDLIQFLTAAGSANLTMDLANGILGAGVSQSVNGDTSGTMTVNEFLTGTVKIVMISQANYRQAGGTGNSIALKNGFVRNAAIFNMGCGGLNFKVSTTNQNLNVMTAFGVGGAAGTFTGSLTQIQQFSVGGCNTGFDHISDNGSYSSTHDGVCVVVGR